MLEASETLEIAKTKILPAAIRYQGELAGAAMNLKAIGMSFDSPTLDAITASVGALTSGITGLETALGIHAGESSMEEAVYAMEKLIPAMAAVRAAADELEGLVADDTWPLPTYQEMLHIL